MAWLSGHIGEHNAIQTLEILLRDSIKKFADGLKNARRWRIVFVKFAQFNLMTITHALLSQVHRKNSKVWLW